MLRSRAPITLALPQFFENDDLGRAWKRARKQEQVRAYRHTGLPPDVMALAGFARRAVARVVPLGMQSR
jgi:hypothetical protein